MCLLAPSARHGRIWSMWKRAVLFGLVAAILIGSQFARLALAATPEEKARAWDKALSSAAEDARLCEKMMGDLQTGGVAPGPEYAHEWAEIKRGCWDSYREIQERYNRAHNTQ